MGNDDHGRLLNAFWSNEDMILQFQDLSTHYLKNTQLKWVREEALSKIKQVEVLD